MLVPRPKDPVKELRKWGKELGISNLTAKDIGVLAEKEADREVAERNSRRPRERR